MVVWGSGAQGLILLKRSHSKQGLIQEKRSHSKQELVLDERITSVLVTETPDGWRYNTLFPVDMVYTWVNGSDPKLQEDLENLKNELLRTGSFTKTKAKSLTFSRFADYGALRFSLRSMETYANWIRHVFIVTNGQIPNWLNLQNPRVTIVKHKEIFDEPEYLPTFSSHAIEHNIHKIKGLSERFIYMNDDYMFGSNVALKDFYTEDQGLKIYLKWNVAEKCGKDCNITMIKNGICDDVCNYDHCVWDGGDCINIPVEKRPKDLGRAHDEYRSAVRYTYAVLNREFGFRRRKYIAHAPLFMDKRIKQDLDKRFPNEVNATIHRKTRSPFDFQFAFAYMYFLMDAYNHSERYVWRENSPDFAYVNFTNNLQSTSNELRKLGFAERKFICINDNTDYNFPKEAKKASDLIEKFYESMFPNPSSFETHI